MAGVVVKKKCGSELTSLLLATQWLTLGHIASCKGGWEMSVAGQPCSWLPLSGVLLLKGSKGE